MVMPLELVLWRYVLMVVCRKDGCAGVHTEKFPGRNILCHVGLLLGIQCEKWYEVVDLAVFDFEQKVPPLVLACALSLPTNGFL
jgi:hypothetical protein